MKLSDFVIRDSIVVDLQATSKEEAIREMVGSLHKAGQLADGEVESVIRAILGREELGSTGIGHGRGCSPHASSNAHAIDRHGRLVAPGGRFRGS